MIRNRRAAIVLALCCGATVSSLFSQETGRKTEKAKQLNVSSSQAGRQTFESICASCHGLDGRGGERGPDIATRAEVVRLSDERLSSILRTGIPQSGMPAFATLGPAKLSATVSHLRLLQGKSATPALPGNPEKGKEIFAGKAGCSECHMVQGLGGFLGPDLSNYAASHSASDVRGAIVSIDKRSASHNSHKTLATVKTKDGKTLSGLVRNEDNFSLQLQSPDGAFHLLTKSDIADVAYDSKPLMPADYATKLSENELNHLVAYLANVAHAAQGKETTTRKTRGKISNEE